MSFKSFRCKIYVQKISIDLNWKTNRKKYPKTLSISSPPGYDAVTVEPKAQQKAAGASKEMGDVWDVEMFCCLNWTPKADFFYGQNPHFIHHTLEKLGACAFHVKMPMWWSSKVYEKWKIRWKSWPCVFCSTSIFQTDAQKAPRFLTRWLRLKSWDLSCFQVAEQMNLQKKDPIKKLLQFCSVFFSGSLCLHVFWVFLRPSQPTQITGQSVTQVRLSLKTKIAKSTEYLVSHGTSWQGLQRQLPPGWEMRKSRRIEQL